MKYFSTEKHNLQERVFQKMGIRFVRFCNKMCDDISIDTLSYALLVGACVFGMFGTHYVFVISQIVLIPVYCGLILSSKIFPKWSILSLIPITVLGVKFFPSGGSHIVSIFLSALIVDYYTNSLKLWKVEIFGSVIFISTAYIVLSICFGVSIDDVGIHSKNFISVYADVIFLCYVLEKISLNKKIIIFHVVCIIILNLISLSLSGLISIVLITYFLIFYLIRDRKAFLISLLFFIFCISFLVFSSKFVIMYDPSNGASDPKMYSALDHYIIGILQRSSELLINPLSMNRWLIWSEYLMNMDMSRFVFGFNSIISLHNSLLTLHGLYGLSCFVLIGMWMSILGGIVRNWMIAACFTVLLLRSLIDSFIWYGGYFDPIILMCLLRCYGQTDGAGWKISSPMALLSSIKHRSYKEDSQSNFS